MAEDQNAFVVAMQIFCPVMIVHCQSCFTSSRLALAVNFKGDGATLKGRENVIFPVSEDFAETRETWVIFRES